MKSFSGKRIWIIGASAGIGNALARALSNEGALLVLSSRNRADLEQLAGVCPSAEVLAVDLAAPESLEQAITQLSAAGRLDAVICTAALYDPARIADLDRARTRDLVQVNLLGMFEVARLCPPLLRDGGQLVLFGSVAGYFGLPGGQAYSATKAAVNNLAESLRLELAPRLDVRLVCPGFVRTRLTAKNSFNMPALIEPEEAARQVMRGLRGRAFEIHFPKRFTLAVKLLRLLPYSLSLRWASRLS